MPRTSAEKAWMALAAIASVVLLVIGYFLFIGPQRADTAAVDGQAASAQVQNETLRARIAALDAENRKLSTYQAALSQAELALPTTSDLPNFLRSLQSLGSATLASVSSLTVGNPTPVTATGATETPGATTSSDAPQPSETSSSAPPGGTTPTSPTPQLFALPITAQVTGSLSQLNDFLGQLQSSQPRAVLVSSVSIAAATPGSTGTTTLDVTMQAFVAPGSLAETQQLAQAASK